MRDLTLAMATALLTTLLLLGLSWPRPLTADDTDEVAGAPEQPYTARLALGDLTLVLSPFGGTPAEGTQQVLLLEAANLGAEPVAVEIGLTLTSERPGSELSRMVLPSLPVWTWSQPLRLEGGSEQRLELPTGIALDPATSYSVYLRAGDRAVTLPLTSRPVPVQVSGLTPIPPGSRPAPRVEPAPAEDRAR